MGFNQGHAVVIGVGSHQFAPYIDVPVTVQDAQAVVDVLTRPDICGYPKDQVELVHDTGATREGILMALDRLAERAGEKDTALVFYCGHGDYGTDGEYYLVGHDAKIDGAKVVEKTGVSQRELLDKLRKLKSGRVLVIFNACHSGELAPNALGLPESFGGQTLPSTAAEALLGTGSGRILLAACREDQVSYIGGGDITIFTQSLIDGLRGKGVFPRGGYTSIFDLYLAVYNTVTQIVHNTLRKTQEPELTIQKGVGPFAVALFRGAAQTDLSLVEASMDLPQGAVRPVDQQRVEWATKQFLGTKVGDIRGVKDSQINIVSGNQDIQQGGVRVGRDLVAENVAGGDLTIQAGGPANIELQELSRLLKELRIRLAQSDLDEETKEAVKEDLKTVEKEARSPQPNKSTLRSRLSGIQGVLQEAVAAGAAAAGLVEVAQKIAGLVTQSIR